ncbi:MAG: hypothetical protein HOP02_16500 [Methylococcaceae bacterium]|nr:hypothetical protein [Methylococcaceae bacterium]
MKTINSKNIVYIFVWLIIECLFNSAKSDDIRLPDSDSMHIGKGYDSITGEVKSTVCVSGTPIPLADGTPQAGNMDYEQTNSLEKLSAFSQTSVAASYGNGAFSADAFYTTLSEKKYSRFNEHLMVKVAVENQRELLPVDRLNPNSLKKDAKKAWKKGQEEFRSLCGDMFIVGKITGGEFMALFSGETSSTEEQNSMAASLNAAGKGTWGQASGSATVEERINQYYKDGKIQAKILRKGPHEEFPQLNVKDIIEYARTFPNRVKGNEATLANNTYSPWTIAWIATNYKALGLVPKDSGLLNNSIKKATLLRSLVQRANGLVFMLDQKHTDEFGDFDHGKARAEIIKINNKIADLRLSVTTCVNAKIKIKIESEECKKDLDETVLEIPARKKELPLDPSVDGLTAIVTTPKGITKVLDLKGTWFYDARSGFYGNRCSPSNNCLDNYTPITNLENGKHLNVVFRRPIRLPQNSTVYFLTHDSHRGDNKTPPSDPLKAIFYEPLYPDDFTFPGEITETTWESKPL